MGLEDPLHSVVGDVMADVPEGALDTPVAPTRVVARHEHREILDRLHDSWSSGAGSVGPLLGDEFAMPTENRVGSHEGRELAEQTASDIVPHDGQASAIIIGQAKPPVTELRAKDAVLFPEELQDLLLLAVQPPGEGGQNEDVRGEHVLHGR